MALFVPFFQEARDGVRGISHKCRSDIMSAYPMQSTSPKKKNKKGRVQCSLKLAAVALQNLFLKGHPNK